jgi:hypothetical protein
MQRNEVGIDTLLLLVKKATIKLKKYESLRNEGDNAAADGVMREMFDMRNDILAAYRGSLHADDPDDQPSAQLTEEVQFLLRALAPGIRRPASDANTLKVQIPRNSRTDPGKVSTDLVGTALRVGAKKRKSARKLEKNGG